MALLASWRLCGPGPAQAQTQAQETSAENDRFSLGAVAGTVVPHEGSPKGTLVLTLLTEGGRPIPEKEVRLGQVGGDNSVRVLRATSDAAGMARFEGLATGAGAAYAAVIEHDGMRLGTDGFRMSDETGMRGEIRSLGRTGDPSVLRLDGRSMFLVIAPMEGAVHLGASFVFKNNSDKVFDPGPDGLLIPLPKGVGSARPGGQGAPVEFKTGEGMIMRAPVSPNRAALVATVAEFQFVVATEDAPALELRQPLPFGLERPVVVLPASSGLSVEAPGMTSRPDRKTADGETVKEYELPPIEPGGTLLLAISGFPTRKRPGQAFTAVLCLLLLAAGVVASRRPREGTAAAKSKLVERREKLFAELMALERERRQAAKGGSGDGADGASARRGELVAKLENVYRELGRLAQGPP